MKVSFSQKKSLLMCAFEKSSSKKSMKSYASHQIILIGQPCLSGAWFGAHFHTGSWMHNIHMIHIFILYFDIRFILTKIPNPWTLKVMNLRTRWDLWGPRPFKGCIAYTLKRVSTFHWFTSQYAWCSNEAWELLEDMDAHEPKLPWILPKHLLSTS